MIKPVPGGTSMMLEFDDEHLEVFLPPVGYAIDRMPDPKTGKPSYKPVKTEILFENAPKKDQKWKRTELPEKWNQWMKDERIAQKTDKNHTNHEADVFRAQEWKRRINGVWIALGNRHNKPTEYVFLTGLAYFYFNWWVADFGHPKFRKVYLKLFYLLQWSDDNPKINGVTASTLRRFGKTAIAYCWMFEFVSRNKFVYGGSQAKILLDAKTKFRINLVEPWKRLPEFFRPKHYDKGSKYATMLAFIKSASTGESSDDMFEEDNALNSSMDFRESKETAYDQAKLHRYVAEEPGKWEEAEIYSTIRKIIPATRELDKIIGKIFAPTTVEELDKGGAEYVEMAEDSMPSQYNKEGLTKSGLIFMFISALEGYCFDEYGRSVIEDPTIKTYGEDGEILIYGAKTLLLRRRALQEGDASGMAEEMRKYPWTWSEAKSVANQFCHFNQQKIQKRIDELNRLSKPLWKRFDLDWVDKIDGDVVATRNDAGGRFQFSWIPDETGTEHEGQMKVLNNVGEEWDEDKLRPLFFPKNDRLFCIGTDPIRYDNTDDPRSSKAAAYGFRKYDPSVDTNVDRDKWQSNCPIMQYLYRPPDFDVYGEDMIKLCRFLGCSILAEENVNTLRKHFNDRGYGRFMLYRRDFNDETLNIQKEGSAGDKGVGTYAEVIDTYMNLTNLYFNTHVNKIVFLELLKDALIHRLAKGKTKDSIVGFGYTMIANKAILKESGDWNEKDMNQPAEREMFPTYDHNGTSKFTPTWKKSAA